MKSAYITDDIIEVIKSGEYQFIRCNFPNGDMVGHTGDFNSTIIGVESVDLALTRLEKVCVEHGVTLIVTADHGNADEMLEKDKKGNISKRTAHSLNPVPFIVRDKSVKLKDSNEFGLANAAPTIAKLMGCEDIPDCWEDSII
jgi:2,3-bisphosphoglycerate-independent phosphoglycerate mutase